MTAGKIPVSVVGATGMVGQRFLQRLDGHPLFQVVALAASDRSEGRLYGEACAWHLSTPLPPAYASSPLRASRPGLPSRIVFSALDAAAAGPLEEDLAKAGHLVFSNASAHRLDADVPLLIPEVNPDHRRLLPVQRRRRGWSGGIVANANCSTMQVALALAPLHRSFGVERALITTLQSVSGGGYPGVPSLDILGNVIPDIPGEAGKIETETNKILGRLRAGRVDPADFTVSARTFRVPVEEGHVAAVSVGLSRRVTAGEIRDSWGRFRGPSEVRRLHSAPEAPVEYLDEPHAPQPRRHRERGGGMVISVGGLEPCAVLDWKFTVLGHNTIRGAAGASVLNAEFLSLEERPCAS
jgi:aspartate-semialdehyde dehydrogenase